jgi:DNA-binding HxlR family transcriptional regulator
MPTKPHIAPQQKKAQPRPIMALLDLLGKRWMLRVVWELREQALTFRALQTACDDISPTVLNTRLKQLAEAQLISVSDGSGYALTPLGVELFERFMPVVDWSIRWAKANDAARKAAATTIKPIL